MRGWTEQPPPTELDSIFIIMIDGELIHSWLDSQNFTLVALPAYLQQQLQSVLNAAARLVFRLQRYDHITDTLAVLHWLCRWVDYKVAVMEFWAMNSLSPPYLDQLVCIAWSSLSALILITSVAAGTGVSSSYCQPAFISSCCMHPSSGTACLLIFSHPPPWPIFAEN